MRNWLCEIAKQNRWDVKLESGTQSRKSDYKIMIYFYGWTMTTSSS